MNLWSVARKTVVHSHATAAASHLAPIPEPYRHWAPLIDAAARKYKLPKAFIAAVMSRESDGRNIVGDGGHGRGLMQIDDRSFGSWLAAHDGGMNPRSNIDKGASLLRANLNYALQHHLHQPFKFAASAYNAGIGGALRGYSEGNSDIFTTGGNYGEDVLHRMRSFERSFGKGT